MSSRRPSRFGFHCTLGFRQRKFTRQSYKSSAEGPPGFTFGTKSVIYMSLFGSGDGYTIQHKLLNYERKKPGSGSVYANPASNSMFFHVQSRSSNVWVQRAPLLLVSSLWVL